MSPKPGWLGLGLRLAGGITDEEEVGHASTLASVAIFATGAGILILRAVRRLPLLPGTPLAHWTEAISGGRWSAAALTGFSVAIVAVSKSAWVIAILGLALAGPATYATVAQVRRRRF